MDKNLPPTVRVFNRSVVILAIAYALVSLVSWVATVAALNHSGIRIGFGPLRTPEETFYGHLGLVLLGWTLLVLPFFFGALAVWRTILRQRLAGIQPTAGFSARCIAAVILSGQLFVASVVALLSSQIGMFMFAFLIPLVPVTFSGMLGGLLAHLFFRDKSRRPIAMPPTQPSPRPM